MIGRTRYVSGTDARWAPLCDPCRASRHVAHHPRGRGGHTAVGGVHRLRAGRGALTRAPEPLRTRPTPPTGAPAAAPPPGGMGHHPVLGLGRRAARPVTLSPGVPVRPLSRRVLPVGEGGYPAALGRGARARLGVGCEPAYEGVGRRSE